MQLAKCSSFDITLDLKNELKNIINKDKQYTIPIFIPHKGCKNECVFCNQRKITGNLQSVTVNEVESIIQEYLSYYENNTRNTDRKIEVAFFGGSFTGLDLSEQISYLEVANKYVANGRVDSIRLSTRPDYISPKILNVLKKYNVGTIELGVQSMENIVLSASKRGHSNLDVKRAARLINLYNFNLGIQIMVGLPNSTIDKEIYTIKEVIKLKPKQLRIYPVYVLKQSELYDMYKSGKYEPLSIDEAVNRSYAIVKECTKTDIQIIRMGLQSTSEITMSNCEIVGPVCDNFAEYVLAKLVLEKIEEEIKKSIVNLVSKDIKKSIDNLVSEEEIKSGSLVSKDEKIKSNCGNLVSEKEIKSGSDNLVSDEDIKNCSGILKNKKEKTTLNLFVPNRYISIAIGPKKINKKYLEEKYNLILKVRGI